MSARGFRLLFAVVALGATIGIAPLARAEVLFEFEAPCLFTCDNAGLAVGQLVTASIGVNDAAVVANGFLGLGDITSFSLSAGTLSFGLADLASFLAQLDATATAAGAFAMLGGNATGGFLIFSDGGAINFFSVGPNADLQAVGGPGTLTRVVQVPEPATLLLLVAALSGLARVSRPRRR